MRLKALSALAAVALLAACETTPTSGSSAEGRGIGRDGISGRPDVSADAARNAAMRGSPEYFRQTVGDRVFFDLDRWDLRPDARATLEKQAAWLKEFPQRGILIEGHADERGTREYNLAIADRRANATKEYLVTLGIPANRIKVVSYGKERPAVVGSNETSYAQNRRSVTVVQ